MNSEDTIQKGQDGGLSQASLILGFGTTNCLSMKLNMLHFTTNSLLHSFKCNYNICIKTIFDHLSELQQKPKLWATHIKMELVL
jgi:hypothetical protein